MFVTKKNLSKAMKSFHEGSEICVKIERKEDKFPVIDELKQG